MGAPIDGSPVVGTNADGRMEVYGRQSDNTLHHVWATGKPDPWWSDWERLTGPIYGNPVVAGNQDRRQELFFIGANHELQHIWQVEPNSGWSGVASLGGSLHVDPAVINNLDGRLEVFQTGDDHTMYHAWQMRPNGSWSGWTSLNLFSVESGPSVARNQSGAVEVFGISGGKVVHAWQPNPGAGEWGHDNTDLGSPEIAANLGATIAELGYGVFL